MTIAIVLLTKDRTPYAIETIQSTLGHALTRQPLLVHIADDGSEPGHIEAIVDAIAATAQGSVHVEGVTVSRTGGHSYGRSMNLAMQTVHDRAEYILPLEDDWRCELVLNLDHICEMLDDPFVGCVRLGYLGWTQQLHGTLWNANGHQGLLLDPRSPERHVFAGHPRLETREWERRVGPWKEGLGAGETEFEVAGREAARSGVFWPFLRPQVFAHIGSIQARTDQR